MNSAKEHHGSAMTVIASIDADLAYETVKGFVDVFNSVNTTIDTLTNQELTARKRGFSTRCDCCRDKKKYKVNSYRCLAWF